jgi:hypothetical protein
VSTIQLIRPDHPDLNTPGDQWLPPQPWEGSALTHDERAWIEALAALGLRSKATSAFTCGDYYVPILVYENHYVRLGRATCQAKTCRDCGTGRMQAHRIYLSNRPRFEAITSAACRTLRLTVSYAAPAASIDDYIARVLAHRPDLATLGRRMRRDLPGDAGYMASVEFDPRLQDVTFRIYYVGYDPHHQWFRSEWQRIIGLRAECESKHWRSDQAGDALRWTLDAIVPILMLAGRERAAWEAGMQGHRFRSSAGSLRGVEAEVKESNMIDDAAAPFGRCPCGCGGALRRPDSHNPNTHSHFAERYRILDFGRLKPYSAYRPKVNAERAREGELAATMTRATHSPPT